MTGADAQLEGDKFRMETRMATKTENRFIQNPVYTGRFFIRMV